MLLWIAPASIPDRRRVLTSLSAPYLVRVKISVRAIVS